MPSALVLSDHGLAVRNFPTAAAARAAQVNRDTDGIGAPLMAVVCAWCGKHLGAIVCTPAQAGMTSHGICPPCKERVLGTLPGRPDSSCAVSSATAGRDRHLFDAASPLARSETSMPLGETGNTTPPIGTAVASEHGSGDPVASNPSWLWSQGFGSGDWHAIPSADHDPAASGWIARCGAFCCGKPVLVATVPRACPRCLAQFGGAS